MKHKLYYIWIFQKKIILPSIVISMLLGIVGHSLNGEPIINNAGFAYLFILPFFQYFTYEVKNPNEYYFYYNLGIGKHQLWASNFIHSVFVEIIILTL